MSASVAIRVAVVGLTAAVLGVGANLAFTEKRCCEVAPALYEAYLDKVAKPPVWTICAGITRGVYQGMRATAAECDVLEADEVGKHALGVAGCIPSLAQQPLGVQIGLIDLGYNAGVGNVCKSSIPRKVATGDLGAACAAIESFASAGGKDCRDPANRCSGIPCRRSWERAHCEGKSPPPFEVWHRTVCPSRPWWKPVSLKNLEEPPRGRTPYDAVPHVDVTPYHRKRKV